MVWRLRNYASGGSFSDLLSSRIIPQDIVVTRFGIFELSGAMLLALARRRTRAKLNSPELTSDHFVVLCFW